MGSPEPKQLSAEPESDDLDFAWDDSFPTRPPPKSATVEAAAPVGPPPHPRLRTESGFPPPNPGVTPLPLMDSSPAVAIDELPAQAEPRARERMITLPDEDPLRYDVGYNKERDITRDSMPTIPDINPLRHDLAPDAESESESDLEPEPAASTPGSSGSRNPA
jgi:hypothetical protein